MKKANRKEYFKKYHEVNREKRITAMRDRYWKIKKEREEWRARNKKWYAENREMKIRKACEWVQKNREARRAWCKVWWQERGKALRFKKEEGRYPYGFVK